MYVCIGILLALVVAECEPAQVAYDLLQGFIDDGLIGIGVRELYAIIRGEPT
jgi:hypothetical protein